MDNWRANAYRLLVKVGIATLQHLFPGEFAREPLKPTDRYLEYPFILKNLPPPPCRVLDVGCSGSFFPLLLSSLNYDVYGIDIREYAIINKIRYNNFTFVKEDIRQTRFPDNHFDVVTAISTIEHIGLSGRYRTDEDPEGDKKAIKEITRVLKPQGLLLLTVPLGKAAILRPYSRIYDELLLKELASGLIVEAEEYYMQDSGGDWFACTRSQASNVAPAPDRYAVALLKLVNGPSLA